MSSLKVRHLVLTDVESLEKARKAGGVVYPSWVLSSMSSTKGNMPPLVTTVKAKTEMRSVEENSNVVYILEDGTRIQVLKELDHVAGC